MGLFDTRTIEEIKRDNARLQAEAEVREDIVRRDIERKALLRENRNLRSPGKKKVIKVVRQTGRGLGVMGKGIGNVLKKGVENYAHSQGTRAVWEKPKPQVRKVKKVKKKKKPQAVKIVYLR